MDVPGTKRTLICGVIIVIASFFWMILMRSILIKCPLTEENVFAWEIARSLLALGVIAGFLLIIYCYTKIKRYKSVSRVKPAISNTAPKTKTKIGTFIGIDDDKTDYYMDANGFLNSPEELEELAVCANSPWSQTNETYEIKYNCKDAYTEKDPSEPDWVCSYTVVGYEMITSVIYGYGNTQNKALENCITMFNWLQGEFNKDDSSF